MLDKVFALYIAFKKSKVRTIGHEEEINNNLLEISRHIKVNTTPN